MAETNATPEPERERIGSGRAAEVFAWEPGRVAKVLRDGFPAEGLEREAKALAAARSAGAPVPQPGEMVSYLGRPGLVMERIDGRDILDMLEKEPWRMWSLMMTVGRVHARLNEAAAPPELPSIKARAWDILANEPRVPNSARPRLLRLLERLEPGDRLCHMDFHPGNVMLSAEGPVIIDLSNASAGPAAADLAKSWVVIGAGEAPPDSPWIGRMLIAFFRKVARWVYMRGYRAEHPTDAAELASWKAIMIAVRLEEGIPSERRTLLRMLSRALREAEALNP